MREKYRELGNLIQSAGLGSIPPIHQPEIRTIWVRAPVGTDIYAIPLDLCTSWKVRHSNYTALCCHFIAATQQSINQLNRTSSSLFIGTATTVPAGNTSRGTTGRWSSWRRTTSSINRAFCVNSSNQACASTSASSSSCPQR